MNRVQRAIGLIAVSALLFALQFLLIAFDASGVLIIPVALAAWFVGPPLLVAGLVMLLPRLRVTASPSTAPGRISLWLLAAFAVLFFLFFVGLLFGLGPDESEHFLDNLYLAIPLSLAGACAVAAGVVAGYALLRRGERSIFVLGSLVFGALVAAFSAAEIGGHEEPRSATPRPPVTASASRSHSNLVFVNVAPGEVRVSFDYVYAESPQGTPITDVTVSPLGRDRQLLAGYQPVVRPISPGSGHMDVTLSFSREQLTLLDGFSVCFTAPGKPDLGCAITGYGPK